MTPLVRLRSLSTGQALLLSSDTAVEVLDMQGRIALLMLPSRVEQCIKLVTQSEETDVAENYAAAHNVEFSKLLVPDLGVLQRPAPPPR